jgi:nucleotide-binding universal stress UspA family protein
MSRREAWLSMGVVFLVALAVRAVAAAAISFPVPEDTAYYAGVARNLAEGRGLISDALWSYQTQPLVVPRAAFEVWMPLPSLLAALPVAVVGAANWFRAAQIVSVTAGSVVAVLAWRLAADLATEMQLPVGRARTMGIGAGLAAAILGPLVLYGALPDSTALFAALSLAACLLMTRIAAAEGRVVAGARAAPSTIQAVVGDAASQPGSAPAIPPAGRWPSFDRRLFALGLVLGTAALTRSEAIWLALAWVVVAWRWTPGDRRRRIGLIAGPAVVALLVFAPWAIRDWLVFGTPLPGQTLSNAIFAHSYDVFAYQDTPTLAGYLGQGVEPIVGQHLAGLGHDLFNVLVIPGFPVTVLGLIALPWVARRRSLRPLVLAAAFTFLATSLVFPVATQSGTYLHASGSAFVLLTVCCIAALDAFIVLVGRLRRWTRPVAWLGPAFAIATVAPLCALTVTGIAHQAEDTRNLYDSLPAAMARAGQPLDGATPVITDNPVWLAEAARVPTLALPEESPDAVLALARQFGAGLLVVRTDGNGAWPDVLNLGGTASKCFQEVPLADITGSKPAEGSPLARIRAFRIVCP